MVHWRTHTTTMPSLVCGVRCRVGCSCVPQSPMPEKLAKTLAAKKRGTKDRFGGMSVEGRGMMV